MLLNLWTKGKSLSPPCPDFYADLHGFQRDRFPHLSARHQSRAFAEREEQIVVAIPYPDLVIGTLEKLKSGVTAYQVESSDELGLALLQLTGKLKRGFPVRMRRWYPEMLPHLDPKDKMGFVMAAIKCGDCQIFRWLV